MQGPELADRLAGSESGRRTRKGRAADHESGDLRVQEAYERLQKLAKKGVENGG